MNDLTNLIDKPTRSTVNSATLIDILTNSRQRIFGEVCHSEISDHDIVYAIRNWKKETKASNTPKLLTTRSFKYFDNKLFCNDLKEVDWGLLTNTEDIDVDQHC